MALKEGWAGSCQEWIRFFTWTEQVEFSGLEKAPHACEGEVPQTHTVRGEKLMTVMWHKEKEIRVFCVCVFLEKKRIKNL